MFCVIPRALLVVTLHIWKATARTFYLPSAPLPLLAVYRKHPARRCRLPTSLGSSKRAGLARAMARPLLPQYKHYRHRLAQHIHHYGRHPNERTGPLLSHPPRPRPTIGTSTMTAAKQATSEDLVAAMPSTCTRTTRRVSQAWQRLCHSSQCRWKRQSNGWHIVAQVPVVHPYCQEQMVSRATALPTAPMPVACSILCLVKTVLLVFACLRVTRF